MKTRQNIIDPIKTIIVYSEKEKTSVRIFMPNLSKRRTTRKRFWKKCCKMNITKYGRKKPRKWR
jgi:hypothetical protein